MVNHRGYILHKVAHKEGRRHEYDIYKKDRPVVPKQVVNVVDLGYLGIEKDFPQQLYHPYRIERKETYYSYFEQKGHNKDHSKKMIVIEHTICQMKKYRILTDVFRNKLKKHNKVSDIVVGLVNYRIMNCHN